MVVMSAAAHTIRAQFQPEVDEFIDDLTMFASGSYLSEEDKELWDEPFDPSVLPELRKMLEHYLDEVDALGSQPEDQQLVGLVGPFYERLEAFNVRHADAVLEPEEKADIETLVIRVCTAAGATDEALEALPDFE